jgi:hypothetical protein
MHHKKHISKVKSYPIKTKQNVAPEELRVKLLEIDPEVTNEAVVKK